MTGSTRQPVKPGASTQAEACCICSAQNCDPDQVFDRSAMALSTSSRLLSSYGEVGLEADGLVEVREGAVQVAFGLAREATVVEG